MAPAEKRPLRSRFRCRGRAPSDRRRSQPSRREIIRGPVHDSATGGLVVPRLLLSWRPRCMAPAEKRPLRSRFGRRGLAPSDRRRRNTSRGARIGGPVPDRATGGLVVPRNLLSWRPRCMEPAEKRPLRSRFGCSNLAPSDRGRDYASRGAMMAVQFQVAPLSPPEYCTAGYKEIS